VAPAGLALVLAASPYRWELDLDTTLVIPGLVLAYLFLVGRYGPPPRWRAACFAGGIVTLAVAFWTPVHHLGLHYLLSMHLLQNVILAEWAPLLVVLAVTPAMAAAFARARVWRALTHPLVARAASAGLVSRRPSSDDGRVVHLRLTQRGERVLAAAVAELGPERQQLGALLARLEAE